MACQAVTEGSMGLVPSVTEGVVRGDEREIMSPKAVGTCSSHVQPQLRFGCQPQLAERICCFNRHYAEPSGFLDDTQFYEVMRAAEDSGQPVTFYDSISGTAVSQPHGSAPSALVHIYKIWKLSLQTVNA